MATITNEKLENTNNSSNVYTYHSVTGKDIKITVSTKWYAVLREEDRKERNNEHTSRRHRGYLTFGNQDADANADDLLLKKAKDKTRFYQDDFFESINEDDIIVFESIQKWVKETLVKKPEWADLIIEVRMKKVKLKDYAAAHNMSDSSASRKLQRATAKLKEVRAAGNGYPFEYKKGQ